MIFTGWEAGMMETTSKNVMLRITSLQRDELGKSETVSLETPGRYGTRGKMTFLTYDETELTGMQGTRTSLLLYPASVALVRTGKILQKQEYTEGEETFSAYETPYGTIDMRVKTTSITNTIQDGRGRLKIVYDVELKGLFNHVNELVIDVWEEQGLHGSQGRTEGNH